MAIVDALTASNNDGNFVQTQTVHFASVLNRRFVFREQTKSTAICRIGKFYLLFAPEMPRDIAFIPSILKRAAKMAGIVNKVYLLFSISLAIFRETSKEMDVETVHVNLKNKSTTFFHGLYSYRT